MSLLVPYLRRTVDPLKKNSIRDFRFIHSCGGDSTTVDQFQGQGYYAEFCGTARSYSDTSAIFTSCNCPEFLVEFLGIQCNDLLWPNAYEHADRFYEFSLAKQKSATHIQGLESGYRPSIVLLTGRACGKNVYMGELVEKAAILAEHQKRMVIIKFTRGYNEDFSILLHHFN